LSCCVSCLVVVSCNSFFVIFLCASSISVVLCSIGVNQCIPRLGSLRLRKEPRVSRASLLSERLSAILSHRSAEAILRTLCDKGRTTQANRPQSRAQPRGAHPTSRLQAP
jgi:hypothetical protein